MLKFINGFALMLLLTNCSQQEGSPSDGPAAQERDPVMRMSWREGGPATPFSEVYYADGTWDFSEQQRALFTAGGAWAKNTRGEVCVTVEATSWPNPLRGETICRAEPIVSGQTALFGLLRAPQNIVEVSYAD